MNESTRQPPPCTNEQSELYNPVFELLRQQENTLQMMQMPKIELMNFDFDPLKYWRCVRAFDNIVKETVGDNVKLARLMQMCLGKASMVIESCVVMEPSVGYKRARQLLHNRLSNSYTGVDAWIKRVTVGQVISPTDCDGLINSQTSLEIAVKHLKQ